MAIRRVSVALDFLGQPQTTCLTQVFFFLPFSSRPGFSFLLVLLRLLLFRLLVSAVLSPSLHTTMTIGDPFMNDSSSNSPTILASNSSPNTSFGHYNNHADAAGAGNGNGSNGSHVHFNSSPIPSTYQRSRQKLSNSPLVSASRCKRRNSESDDRVKKLKHFSSTPALSSGVPADQLTLQNINLEEYPKFNHPDGGIIQFTPIGNIRTYMNDCNVVQRTIEKNSSFDLNQTDRGIDGYKLYLGSVSMDSSPSNEIETYMRNGYGSNIPVHSSHYDNPACCTSSCCASNFDYDCDSDLEDDDDYMS